MASDYDFQTIRINELEAKLQRAEETLAMFQEIAKRPSASTEQVVDRYCNFMDAIQAYEEGRDGEG